MANLPNSICLEHICHYLYNVEKDMEIGTKFANLAYPSFYVDKKHCILCLKGHESDYAGVETSPRKTNCLCSKHELEYMTLLNLERKENEFVGEADYCIVCLVMK